MFTENYTSWFWCVGKSDEPNSEVELWRFISEPEKKTETGEPIFFAEDSYTESLEDNSTRQDEEYVVRIFDGSEVLINLDPLKEIKDCVVVYTSRHSSAVKNIRITAVSLNTNSK